MTTAIVKYNAFSFNNVLFVLKKIGHFFCLMLLGFGIVVGVNFYNDAQYVVKEAELLRESNRVLAIALEKSNKDRVELKKSLQVATKERNDLNKQVKNAIIIEPDISSFMHNRVVTPTKEVLKDVKTVTVDAYRNVVAWYNE